LQGVARHCPYRHLTPHRCVGSVAHGAHQGAAQLLELRRPLRRPLLGTMVGSGKPSAAAAAATAAVPASSAFTSAAGVAIAAVTAAAGIRIQLRGQPGLEKTHGSTRKVHMKGAHERCT